MPERVTDEQLLYWATSGEEDAFVLLYERHRDAVFRFAYRLLGSAEMAEDVTHDCFLSLIKQPGRYDPTRASLRAYLYGATRNLAFKHFRDADKETAVDELEDETRAEDGGDPLRQLLAEELSSEIRRAVSSLPALQREAIVLFEYEELTLAEIAAIVGADVGTVKARLHRARERLRKRLGPYLKRSGEIAAVEKA